MDWCLVNYRTMPHAEDKHYADCNVKPNLLDALSRERFAVQQLNENDGSPEETGA
jgi:hypothetical protein